MIPRHREVALGKLIHRIVLLLALLTPPGAAHAGRVRRVFIAALALGLAVEAGGATVSTQRNGLSRTGEYSDAFLQPSVVGFRKFGKVWEYPVTGFIYAQPLLVDQVHTT